MIMTIMIMIIMIIIDVMVSDYSPALLSTRTSRKKSIFNFQFSIINFKNQKFQFFNFSKIEKYAFR